MNTAYNSRKSLLLHVGHGATGSSYIQSSLALTKGALVEAGIEYPDHPSLKDARSGFITSGNISHERWLEEIDAATSMFPSLSFLFSNEHLFWSVLNQKSALADLRSRFDLKILLFIKNPLSHMTSRYVQSVKRGGNVGILESHALAYDVPYRVLEFLEALIQNEIRFQVINYSNIGDDLLSRFYLACGLEKFAYTAPPLKRVNRSLTLAELELQRLFNLHYGPASQAFISDALCNLLPGVEVLQRPRLSDRAYQEFRDRMAAGIEKVNALLPEPERYTMEVNPSAEGIAGTQYGFSREQLEVLVRSISGSLARKD
jgi:hypothetical protein